MDITTLENWLWEAACSIRGPLDAPKYKDYILPLLFYKRLSDVYEDELGKLSQEFGDEALARQLAQKDRALIRFYIPNGYTWSEVRKNPIQLGQRLTDAMRAIAKENPKLVGVIDIVDFNATAAGQRILDDDNLARLMEILNRQRLGLRDVEPDILGRAYEYLLRTFDKVTANPMWNQKFGTEVYENDTYGRFTRGTPPASSADWGWIQHMFASLSDPSTDSGRGGGKMAVVLDTGAVSRGSGNQGSNKERDVRRTFVEGDLVAKGDLVEAVILLPENLFYNTTAPGIIMVLNKAKAHPGEILLINASKLCAKGRPKNYLTDEHIQQIYEIYRDWRAEDGVSAVITTQEAARNDYNLSPSRYVASDEQEPPLPLEESLVLLVQAEEERAEADAELDAVLQALGFEGWQSGA